MFIREIIITPINMPLARRWVGQISEMYVNFKGDGMDVDQSASKIRRYNFRHPDLQAIKSVDARMHKG